MAPADLRGVEPIGSIEDDPNVTDKRFPGNPTRSYRTTEPASQEMVARIRASDRPPGTSTVGVRTYRPSHVQTGTAGGKP